MSPRFGLVASALTALTALAGCSSPMAADTDVGAGRTWTLSDERALAARREDPATWDLELLEADRGILSLPPGVLPGMPYGVWPVPAYDLIGENAYNGNSTGVSEQLIGDRHVVGVAFMVGRNAFNESLPGGDSAFTVVHVLVACDEPPRPDGSNLSAGVSSRNAPHVLGSLWLDSGRGEIEALAFQTGDGDAFAIINLRLFDLDAGRCIVISPQADGTLRSLQRDVPDVGPDEIESAHAAILARDDVRAFLDADAGS